MYGRETDLSIRKPTGVQNEETKEVQKQVYREGGTLEKEEEVPWKVLVRQTLKFRVEGNWLKRWRKGRSKKKNRGILRFTSGFLN